MSKPTRSHGSKRFTSRRTRSSKAKQEAMVAEVQDLFGEDSSSVATMMLPEGSKTDKKSDNLLKKKKGVAKIPTESATREATDSDNEDKPIKEYLVPIVQGNFPVKNVSASEVDDDMKPSAAKIPRLAIPEDEPTNIQSLQTPDLLNIPLPTTKKGSEKKEIFLLEGGNTSGVVADEKGPIDTDENIPSEVAKKDDDKEEADAAAKKISSEDTKIGDVEKQEKSTTEKPYVSECKIIKDSPASPDPAGNNDIIPSASTDAEKQDDGKEILPLDTENNPAEVSDEAAATLAAIDSAIEELMAGANAAVAAAQNQAAGEQNSAQISDAAREGSISPLAPLDTSGIILA